MQRSTATSEPLVPELSAQGTELRYLSPSRLSYSSMISCGAVPNDNIYYHCCCYYYDNESGCCYDDEYC